MQDVDKLFLKLVIGDSLGQQLCPANHAKLPATYRLFLASVPAELLVDGVVLHINEEAESLLRQLRQVDGHQDFSDLVEISSQGEVADLCSHQVEVLTQQHW